MNAILDLKFWILYWRTHRRIAHKLLLLMLGMAILGVPLAADAQQAGKVYSVGILALNTAAGNAPDVAAFRERLGQLGYVEGQNLHMETRFADGERDRLPGAHDGHQSLSRSVLTAMV